MKMKHFLNICGHGVKTFATVANQQSVQRCLGQPTAYSHPFLMKTDEVTPGLTKENYRTRRHNLIELICNEKVTTPQQDKISNKHIIVVLGNPVNYMSQDIPYQFHQNTNFSYLTGFQEPDSCLVMESMPGCEYPNHKSTLFVQKRDPVKELWNGIRAGTDGALEHTGVDYTEEIESLGQFLTNHISEQNTIWFDFHRMTNLQLHLNHVRGFLQTAHKKGIQIRQVEAPIHEQRNIKSSEERTLMLKSCDVISEAISDTMAYCKPGMNEIELNARIEFVAKKNGAQMLAFPPVVASGNRANTLHYVDNDQIIEEGSLVLVDAGARYHGYVSDVTRTFPINGKFTEVQRTLYEAVLRVQEICIRLCTIGQSIDDIYNVMTMTLGKELYDTGVFKEKLKPTELMQHVRELCPHHVGHWLGMDVHDTPDINRSMKFLPGMVITIEPGLYIREDNEKVDSKYRGIGIRIEDDILITEGEPIVLSSKCPKSVEDIERIMAKG
ncbi:xaa-Pro aminopeptidase 3-like [Styela clava]